MICGRQERRLTDNEMLLSGLLGKFIDSQWSTASFYFSHERGGLASGLVCSPMELVLIQQQNFGGTIFSTPSSIIRKYGLLGMGRGTVATCGREGFWCCGYMGLGPVAHRYVFVLVFRIVFVNC
jgi:hypothetical protein